VTWSFVLKTISWELIGEDYLFGHLLLYVITITEAFGVRKDNLKVSCEIVQIEQNIKKYYVI